MQSNLQDKSAATGSATHRLPAAGSLCSRILASAAFDDDELGRRSAPRPAGKSVSHPPRRPFFLFFLQFATDSGSRFSFTERCCYRTAAGRATPQIPPPVIGPIRPFQGRKHSSCLFRWRERRSDRRRIAATAFLGRQFRPLVARPQRRRLGSPSSRRILPSQKQTNKTKTDPPPLGNTRRNPTWPLWRSAVPLCAHSQKKRKRLTRFRYFFRQNPTRLLQR